MICEVNTFFVFVWYKDMGDNCLKTSVALCDL